MKQRLADLERRCADLERRTGADRYRKGAEIKRKARGQLWMAVHDAEAYRAKGDAVLLFLDGSTVVL